MLFASVGGPLVPVRRRWRCRAALAALLVGVSTFATEPARAGDPARGTAMPGAPPASTSAPAIAWLDNPATRSDLSAAARNATATHVRHLGVELVDWGGNGASLAELTRSAARVADLYQAVGVFFVVSDDRGRATLYLYVPQPRGLFAQELAGAYGGLQSSAETLALTATAATRALVARRPVGMETRTIPEPAETRLVPPPVAPGPSATDEVEPSSADQFRDMRQRERRKRRSDRHRLRSQSLTRARVYEEAFASLALGYAGSSVADAAPWQQGAAFRLGITVPLGLHIAVAYTVFGPLTVTADPNTVELRRHPLELAIGYRRPIGQRLYLRPELGAVVDLVQRRSRSEDPSLEIAPDAEDWLVGLVPSVATGVDVTPVVALEAGFRGELWLRNQVYQVAAPAPETVIAPRLFRPSVWVGLSVAYPKMRRQRTGSSSRANNKLAGSPARGH